MELYPRFILEVWTYIMGMDKVKKSENDEWPLFMH